MTKKSTFNQNFDNAIMSLMNCAMNEVELYKFKLNPIYEEKGKESSKDSWMKYAKLKNNNIEELKSYEDTIWLLSAGNSNYPLWITMKKNDEKILELDFSTRFRHIKTCHNQEYGFPPFEIIK